MSEPFKIDRHINVGHIFTTAIIIVSAVVAYVRLEGKVELNADNIADNARAIVATEQRRTHELSEIKGLLVRIEEKLDRKVDK